MSEPEGAAPAIISNHAFRPGRNPWLCRYCRLAEATHARREQIAVEHADVRPEPFPVPEIDLSEMQEHRLQGGAENPKEDR